MPAAHSVYLVGGSDEFAIKEHAAKLAARLAPKDASEFGVEVIEGDAANADEALQVVGRLREALFTVGLFGGDKLVWWKNTNLLGAAPPGGEATLEALGALSDELKRGLPPGVTLLISAPAMDRRRSLARTLEKMAETFFFEAPDLGKPAGEEQIESFLRERLAAEKKRFADGRALEAFRSLVAPTMREMANELEKLCLYVGSRAEITEADVRAVCSATREAVIWELLDAVGGRKLPQALAALKNLLDNGESPIGILIMLVTQIRLILLTKDHIHRKVLAPGGTGIEYVKAFERLPDTEKQHFPLTKEGKPPSPWRLYRCALAARHFSFSELIHAMDLLQEANLQLVSSQLDERLVLQEVITKIARKTA